MDFQKMMQQAQQMQSKLQELQEKLADIEVGGESGGGLVRVVMTCDGTVQGIAIDPSLIDPKQCETLEDLVVAAVNSAAANKDSKIQDETRGMMKALGLPENAAAGGLPF